MCCLHHVISYSAVDTVTVDSVTRNHTINWMYIEHTYMYIHTYVFIYACHKRWLSVNFPVRLGIESVMQCVLLYAEESSAVPSRVHPSSSLCSACPHSQPLLHVQLPTCHNLAAIGMQLGM